LTSTVTQRRDARIAEIVACAWTLAREHGIGALSLRALAHEVGMRQPSLYEYFDSKHAIYDAMFAQGAQELLDRERAVPVTGDVVRDLKAGARLFVGFCTEDPVRYQLMFQRFIPGFEPSPESYAMAVETLQIVRERLAASGLTDPRDLDLLTAVTAGLTNQQIANEPGGDRWVRLVDEAIEMYFEHVSQRTNQTPKHKQKGTRK